MSFSPYREKILRIEDQLAPLEKRYQEVVAPTRHALTEGVSPAAIIVIDIKLWQERRRLQIALADLYYKSAAWRRKHTE